MFQKSIVDNGFKLYINWHNIVVEIIMDDPECQEEADKSFLEQVVLCGH